MGNSLVIDVGIHWVAVVVYAFASVENIYGLIFNNDKAERISYFTLVAGLLIHGAGLIYRWIVSGHGPYMVRYEVLSSNAWIVLLLFIILVRFFPKIKPISIFIFPAAFFLIAISLLFNPETRKLPPSLKSVWLVLHVTFYKIALGTILIAFAFSVLYIFKKRREGRWLKALPEPDVIDEYAYRFAGFGFTVWAIAMLAGSIWAYQSWGRFWGWDPVETWSLITWIFFGIYLHLRRFFGWKGERAALLFISCFLLSLVTIFFVPLVESSIHSSYFR